MSTSSITCKSLDFDVIKDLQRNCDSTCLEPVNILQGVWKYRGEGNANVVVALEDDNRVIRLSKVNVGEPVSDMAKHRRKVEREVIFANKIFGPLLGPEFVGSVKAIQLRPDQISQLNKTLENLRPAHRRHKEIRVPYATSHSDFARSHRFPSHGVDFCVEIKPKQGWWPSSIRNCDGDLPKLCTYCLNQFLKLKRAKISSRTAFCPLDLFSGNPERMIEAVTALIAQPQNNFRVFCDGKLMYGDGNDESLENVLYQWMGCDEKLASIHDPEMPSTLNSFVYLLCAALLKPKYIPDKDKFYQSNDSFNVISRQLRKILCHTPAAHLFAKIISKSPQGIKQSQLGVDTKIKDACSNDASPLPEGCILSRILEIQKLADRQSTLFKRDPSIYSIYQKICPVHAPIGKAGSPVVSATSDIVSSDDLLDFGCSSNETSPRLDVILAGDSYDSDNFVDSGNETERMSDSESFEDAFEASSTEEDEDETIMASINYDDDSTRPPMDSTFQHPIHHQPFSDSVECPSSACLSSEKWLDEIENLPLSEAEVMAVEMYLLAATAKDCSIMVTFSPTNNNCEEQPKEFKSGTDSLYKDTDILLEDLNQKLHRIRIGVADLDPKPVTTIVRHYLRDNEMIQAYSTLCHS